MTEQTLLKRISDSLWTGVYSPDIPAEVLEEAQLQTVAGLIQPPTYRQIAFYTRYCYEESQLLKLLDSREISAVILKGSAAAIYYPVPVGRSFGDIDFIVPPECFSAAARLLEENGYARGADEDRHIAYRKNGVEFELHRCFFRDAALEKYVLDGLAHREVGRMEEHEFPMLPPLANGLVLLEHMRSHLKSGMGLRQVIDWMMYCDKVLDDAFWRDSFCTVAEKAGLTTLAITAAALCQRHLGLKKSITWCRDADDTLVDQLLESLMCSGNFGCKQGRGSNVERIVTFIQREGLFHYLQRAGEYNWKAYHKHAWLRPFCWIYQIIRYMKQGRNRAGSLKADIERGNERYELLKKLGI